MTSVLKTFQVFLLPSHPHNFHKAQFNMVAMFLSHFPLNLIYGLHCSQTELSIFFQTLLVVFCLFVSSQLTLLFLPGMYSLFFHLCLVGIVCILQVLCQNSHFSFLPEYQFSASKIPLKYIRCKNICRL